MKIDLRLFQFARKQGNLLVYSVISEILKTALTLWFAWQLSVVLDKVFLREAGLAEISGNLRLLLLISLGRLLLGILSSFSAISLAGKIKNKLRSLIIEKVMASGMIGLAQEESAEISVTLNTGVEKLDAWFSQFLPQIFFSALIPLFILFLVFPIDLLSGAVFLFTAPIIPIFMALIGSLTESKTRRQWQVLSRMSSHFLDILQGLTTLKILGRSKDKISEIYQITDLFRQSTMDVLKIAFLSALVLEIAATVSTAVIAVEIGLRLLYDKITFQPALFILILAPEFYQPFRQLGARFHASVEGVSVMNRIQEILDKPGLNHSLPSLKQIDLKQPPEIRIENLGFTYPNREKPAICKLNLHLPAGKITALTGPSGAGKTTLMNLICRLLNPQTGKIRVDGTDLLAMDEKDYLRLLSWLPQKPYILNASIEENMRLAKPKATQPELNKAANSARLLSFIESLPEQWQTRVGEQGTRLSGGEIQRLALARAFLKNAPILILDEPTAALDPELESEISATIRNLSREKTTLIIAHRLNTIKSADQVVVMEQGRIIQTGPPAELFRQAGALALMLTRLKDTTL